MLKHLEADRYEEYPAEVFARGHLRNYAREVDLEPELVLQSFDRYTGQVESTVDSDDAESHATASDSEGSDTSLDAPEPLADVEWSGLWNRVRPSHLVAGVLMLTAIVTIFSFTGENKATAQGSSDFSESETAAERGWDDESVDQRADKSRWLMNNQSAETTTQSETDSD